MIGNKTGKLGEDIAALYLERKGFNIIERNYWKPYGEIDIVAQKGSKLHFVEVKAVSRLLTPERSDGGQARESYNAAENVHAHKLKKLGRVIQAFLQKAKYRDMDWRFDICVVQIDAVTKKAKVKMIENELLPE